jgi:hypothetical protein
MELLAASGATKADPNIRQELRSEVVKQGKRKSYSDTVLFWRGRKGDSGTPLDANEEAVRLASQEPVTPSTPSQAEPVIEKESASVSAPTEQEKKAAEKESSGGWFNWF